ncbi:hypothetical protein J6590_053396 [Homalodisca vitripennis]|nr:hypothetical protein J6590_053396 [Homalodisca vitripennis]
MKAAQSRSDARIGFVQDLVAAEAKYHNDCIVSLLKPTTGGKVGRPQDQALAWGKYCHILKVVMTASLRYEYEMEPYYTGGELARTMSGCNLRATIYIKHLR